MKNLFTSVSLASLLLFAPLPNYGDGPIGNPTAYAQSVVSVGNVTIGSGNVVVAIPSMTIEGSSASEADIRAMFDPKGLNQLASRFKAFSARSVTIPEITLIQTLPDGSRTSTIYRDTVMSDISNGLVGAMNTRQATAKSSEVKAGDGRPSSGRPSSGRPNGTSGGGASGGGTSGGGQSAGEKQVSGRPRAKAEEITPPAIDMTMDNIVYKALNVSLLARFLNDKAEHGEKLETVVAEQSIGNTVFKIDTGILTIGRIFISDFKLKPLGKPFMQSIAALDDIRAKNKDLAEKESLQLARDMLTSFSFGNLEATGISAAFPIEDNKISRVSLDKIRMSGGGNLSGSFSMQGLKVDYSDNKVGVGEFALSGIRYPELATTLEKLATSGNSSDFKPETMVPTIEQVRLAAIDIDLRTGKDMSERLKAKLGQFDIKMSNHVGPIPTNVTILLDRAQTDIPANTNDTNLKSILALGYKAIDVSMRYDQSYDQANKTLKLNELSINSVGMFAAQAKAELTNVVKEIFTTDKAVASVAALGVMAKSVSIQVKNDSLFEKIIAQQASAQKRKPDDVRAELAAGATIMVPMFLGEHPGAQVLGAALGKFLADPKNIKIDLTAKSSGIGAVDFLATKNPIEILKKVDITASSNQ